MAIPSTGSMIRKQKYFFVREILSIRFFISIQSKYLDQGEVRIATKDSLPDRVSGSEGAVQGNTTLL